MDPYKKVVIVGKPNVGKSQLFNRLTGERHSVVHDEPGITRDRLMLPVTWSGRRFNLIDTGGYTDDGLTFQSEINIQTEIALKESDLVLFVVSCKEPLTSEDHLLSKMLKRKRVKNILVVANKCDLKNPSLQANGLGFGEATFISAEHGINTGLLLDRIVERLELAPASEPTAEEEYPKIAILGRPNVGKSSLVNALLDQNRIITSDLPGTTRDAVDIDLEYSGERITLIDTPGIRRHASIHKEEREKFSLLRSHRALERASMVWFMVDISEGLCELDERIGGLIYKSNVPSVMVVNKCDLIEGDTAKAKEKFREEIRTKFKYLSWVPIVFISAKEKDSLGAIFSKSRAIRREITKEIDERLFGEFLHSLTFLYSVPNVKGRKLRLFSLSRKQGQVPTFLFLCNDPKYLHFSYARLIESQIRTFFGYKICPITVIYKKK